MQRWLTALGALVFLIAVLPVAAQTTEADMQGAWQVYPVRQLSRYTLSEHQSGEPTTVRGVGTLQLNLDGTLTTDLAEIEALSWSIDEGFLLLEQETGRNLFFLPRPLADNFYFLVEVEVTELNERIIYLRSNPNGSLVLIRQ